MLTIGSKAPDFKVRCISGEIFRLRDYRGKQPVVVSFIPEDFVKSPAKDSYVFIQQLLKAQSLGATVIIISPKEMNELKKLTELYKYSIPITTDPTLEVCRNYRAVWLRGLAIRNLTYIIDKNGIIRGTQNHRLLHEKPWKKIMNILKELKGESSKEKEN